MYLYRIPSDGDQQPDWFRSRLTKLFDERGFDRSWVWYWNDTYDRKITVRNGVANLVFNDEADYMWFILQWA